MIKEVVNDYVHLTEMEFLIKHPLVVIGTFAVFVVIMLFIWSFKDKRKKK